MVTSSRLTVAQFLALPETEPAAEYGDGESWQKPMPTALHGFVQSLLSFVFVMYLRGHPGGYAGSEVRCLFRARGQTRILIPDFIFVRNAAELSLDSAQPVVIPPTLAAEILSPGDPMTEVMDRAEFYLEAGVACVVIIDPRRRRLMLSTESGHWRTLSENDTWDGGQVLPGFAVAVRELLPPIETKTPTDEHAPA